MSTYKDELERAMLELSLKEDTIFLGQSLEYGGIAMAHTFDKIPLEKKVEMPVAENLQLGISIGMSLNGFVPISIMTDGQFQPKVIIRVAFGATHPVNPQEQHLGDFSDAYEKMLKTVEVVRLRDKDEIVEQYLRAYNRKDGVSTILVEGHQF